MGIKFLFIALLLLSLKADGQWFNQNINTTSPLGGIQFVTPNTGWVIGSNPSKFYKTTDGGENWLLQYSTDGPVVSRYFLNENIGWFTDMDAVGCRLIKTVDGGNSWQQVYSLPYGNFTDLLFFNASNGIATEVDMAGVLYKTSDGGSSWQNVDIYSYGLLPGCLYFLDQDTGWCGGHAMFDGNSILMTTDGGDTWTPYPADSLNQIGQMQFFDALNAWVINDWSLYSTTNGGITWNQRASWVNRFSFINPLEGWYVSGGGILYTSDGGINWTTQYSNSGATLYDIFFIDNNKGWASGSDGLMLHTINGGTPVELTSFTAEYNNDAVYLNWITSTETNNRGFNIERKSDNEIWQNIAFVEGNGTTSEQHSYSFKDKNVTEGVWLYRLKQVDLDGSFEYSDVVEVSVNIPMEYALEQNYPNPFNPATKIKYSVASEGLVNLSVYNLLGQKVAELKNEVLQPGYYETNFDASSLSSGVYVYKLSVEGKVISRKMVVLK